MRGTGLELDSLVQFSLIIDVRGYIPFFSESQKVVEGELKKKFYECLLIYYPEPSPHYKVNQG